MRNNQPVTQHELELPDGATLMSTTDTDSRITYANAAFVQVSGFELDELKGQPHNVVRHPDMPAVAFEDMWRTLKGGEPWTALVKNRRKDGDYYWVRANAVPIIRNGQTTGYMSVRTKPSRDEVAGAEAVYRDLREGAAGGRGIYKGLVVRTGLMRIGSLFQVASVRTRLRLAMAAFAIWQVAACWALGLTWSHTAAMAALTLIGMTGTGLFLKRQISDPLQQVLKDSLAIATGDRHEATPMNRVDEIGMLNRTVGQLGLMFRWLASDVGGQAAGVQNASREIAQGNLDLSRRTEQAAMSVQQTASAMTQMTSAVQNNAETAKQADGLSVSSRDAATRGGKAVAEVTATMGCITADSRKVADIVDMIEGIAFQTNILALNAAVEAARARTQGRGFAVVAGEVRALAQRSATAAKEIRQLIGDSVGRIESGSQLVTEASQAMDEIVDRVNRVCGLIEVISSATAEQSLGLTQVCVFRGS